MAPLVDQLLAANATMPDPGESANQGAALMARAQQMNIQKQQLQMQQQQVDDNKDNYMLNIANQAASETDPGKRGILLDHMDTMGQKWGKPISDDFYGLMQKSDDYRSDFANAAQKTNFMDTGQRAGIMAKYKSVFSGDAPAAIKGIQDLNQPSEDILKAQNQAQLLYGKLNYQNDLTNFTKFQSDLRSSGAPADILAKATDPSVMSDPVAQGYVSKYHQQLNSDKSNNINDQITNRDEKTSQGDRRLDIMQNLGQQRVALTKEALVNSGKRLTLGQERLLNSQEDKVEQLPSVKAGVTAQQAGETALAVLNRPDVKWIDLQDATAAYTKQLEGFRPAFGSEQNKSFTSIQKTVDQFSGKIQNNENGGPSPEEIKLFKDRIQNNIDVMGQLHDQSYLRYWKGKAATGIVDPTVARTHFMENQLSPGVVNWPLAQTPAKPKGSQVFSPQIPQSQPAAPTTGSSQSAPPNGSAKKPSAGFIQGLMQKFNDSGKVKSFLNQNGYDSSGVQ